MSRSYKKHPFVKDGNSAKKEKQCANRKFRRCVPEDDDNIIFGKNKKYRIYLTDPWDIHDYTFLCTEEEARKYYRKCKEQGSIGINDKFFQKYPDEETYIKKHWEKYYKRK